MSKKISVSLAMPSIDYDIKMNNIKLSSRFIGLKFAYSFTNRRVKPEFGNI